MFVVVCVCVSFASEVGVCFMLRCLHEPVLLYLVDWKISQLNHDNSKSQF